MATLRQVMADDTLECTSVKWVNEHGHDVIYFPANQFFTLPPDDAKQTIYLHDPNTLINGLEFSELHVLIVVGMEICGVGRRTTDQDGNRTIVDLDEITLLPEHYVLFHVKLGDAYCNMVDYYEKELFKTNTKA